MDTIKEALPIFVFPDCENEKLVDPYNLVQDLR